MPWAQEFLDALHDRGYKVMIHSCNRPEYIREQCEKWNLRVDGIWGETGLEAAKPVAACYLDDRAVGFRGDLKASLEEILDLVEKRAVRGSSDATGVF